MAVLAALALFATGPASLHAQAGGTGMTAITKAQLGQSPFKYTGAVICLGSDFLEIPNNVGSGSIAQDPRIVISDVFLPFNPTGSNTATQFTQRNYFALAYNATATPTKANGKLLRGYIYSGRYAELAVTDPFSLTAFATSIAVFYSNADLITGAVLPISTTPGTGIGIGITKLVAGYSASQTNSFIYQSGNVTSTVLNLGDPLYIMNGPLPATLGILGGGVWINVNKQWSLEAIAFESATGSTGTATATGTAIILIENGGLTLVTQALAIVGNGSARTGPPRPTVNATDVYNTLQAGTVSIGVQHLQVNNAGTGLLTFNGTSSQPWLRLSPGKATTRTAPVAVALNYDTIGLPVGNYTALLLFSNSNAIKSVNVHLNIVAAPVPVPTGVAASRTRSDGVLITWNAVATAVKYEVYRGLVAQATNLSDLGSTTRTNYLDTSAAPRQAYHYFIKAIDAGGRFSAYSKQVVGIKNP